MARARRVRPRQASGDVSACPEPADFTSDRPRACFAGPRCWLTVFRGSRRTFAAAAAPAFTAPASGGGISPPPAARALLFSGPCGDPVSCGDPVTSFAKMSALLLAALLAGAPASSAAAGPADARREAAAELARIAPRIEELKRQAAAGRPAGPELERLLARAQELAALLERLDRGAPAAAPIAPGPDAQELRERADALRDRADHLAAELALTERRIAEARRQAELAERLEAVSGSGDLFGDSAPRRARRSGPAEGVNPVTPPLVGPGAVEPLAPASPAPAAAPGGSGSGPLASGGEELRTLRRLRDELAREVASLRARAEALQAEARALESGR